jgi:hypothetical protein
VELEADNSLPFSDNVENEWSYPPLPHTSLSRGDYAQEQLYTYVAPMKLAAKKLASKKYHCRHIIFYKLTLFVLAVN